MKFLNYSLALSLSAVLMLPTAFADSSIEFSSPKGGWQAGSASGERFTQEVHYPANFVNTPSDQAASARILGLIKGTPKQADTPGELIINGVSMPLKIDNDGRFDRPFSFPDGSNSVEVRSPDHKQRKRIQFLKTGGGAPTPKLRVLLSWDSDNTDLDLHLVTPDGEHVWYGHRVANNGAALDVDVTSGYGPEIISMPAPLKGQYLVYVNYYGGGDSSEQVPITTAKVVIITQEGTPSEKVESFIIPMRTPGELTLVKTFNVP